jgi:hypothetical protein
MREDRRVHAYLEFRCLPLVKVPKGAMSMY